VIRSIGALLAAILMALPAAAQDKPKLKVGYGKCAQCFSMLLVPAATDKIDVELTGFTTAQDGLTAMIAKSVDAMQATYLHLVAARDKGFDVVAISGHVNGGSDIIISNSLTVAPDDWTAFKALVMERKAAGKPMRIASSRGSAQDIHLRGELAVHGIDANKDIEFINIPNFPDHGPSLQRGEIDAVCTVEPFASQFRLAGMGKHFAFPYTQAAGNLTGLILTRGDVIKEHPAELQELVSAIWRVNEALKADRTPWIQAIKKVTGLDDAITTAAMPNVYPDSMMYRQKTIEIAKMMRDLKYTATDQTGSIDQGLDYEFLIKASGQPKESLGW
jgi:ABC-type nitrate/sulfonate/bicarbonate transport system substrate-binding protein